MKVRCGGVKKLRGRIGGEKTSEGTQQQLERYRGVGLVRSDEKNIKPDLEAETVPF